MELSRKEVETLLADYQACSDRGHPLGSCHCASKWTRHGAELAREVLKLRSLPCDSDLANRWLNENAPQHVLDSLWAWRRVADEALKVAQAVKALEKTNETKR